MDNTIFVDKNGTLIYTGDEMYHKDNPSQPFTVLGISYVVGKEPLIAYSYGDTEDTISWFPAKDCCRMDISEKYIDAPTGKDIIDMIQQFGLENLKMDDQDVELPFAISERDLGEDEKEYTEMVLHPFDRTCKVNVWNA